MTLIQFTVILFVQKNCFNNIFSNYATVAFLSFLELQNYKGSIK